MKPKDIRIVALILVALMIGGVLWWLMRRSEDGTGPTPKAILAAKADAPKMVVQAVRASQVELPKAAPVGAKPETADSQTEAAAIAQAELKASLHDMAAILRQKGIFSLALDYYPPDFATERSPDEIRQGLQMEAINAEDPQVQQTRELLARRYDYLATLTPTLNARGDQATYSDPDSDKAGANHDDSDSIIAKLIKINGKWHLYTVPGDDPATPFPP